MMKISKSDSSAAGHYEDGCGISKSYNRFTRELALETVLKNKDTLKAILANAEYICRQMIFEDVVEINP